MNPTTRSVLRYAIDRDYRRRLHRRLLAFACLVGAAALLASMLSGCAATIAPAQTGQTPEVPVRVTPPADAIGGAAANPVGGSGVSGQDGESTEPSVPPSPLDGDSTVMLLASLVDVLGERAEDDPSIVNTYRLSVEILADVMDLVERTDVAVALVDELRSVLREWPGRAWPDTQQPQTQTAEGESDARPAAVQRVSERADQLFEELSHQVDQ